MPPTAIKIGSELVENAREAAETSDRSLTGQVEHWAKLGRSVERFLSTPMISALKKSGGDPDKITNEAERDELLRAISALRETPPFAETRSYLRSLNTPLYEADPENAGRLFRVEPDGTRTRGQLVGRVFEPEN
ncbi:MAG: hypothetical protein KBF76_08725 [Verrucomicrobiales bacterium]|nr:hypothetical protein [Verrucomicrobiales bacterium]